MFLMGIVQRWLTRADLWCWLPPVLIGGLLRFWSLSFGLPNFFRPDEDMVVLPALRMIGGDLDPHDYTYPTLYKYFLAGVFRACMALDLGAAADEAWQYVAYGFFVDGSFFILTARIVTAILGTATIVAVYLIGRDGYNRWVGAAGAWVTAVGTLHVRDSHFGVTDVPSVALLTFGLVFAMRIAQRGAWRDYGWAGAMMGLAASTKYGAIVGLVSICIAHWVQKPVEQSWLRWIRDIRLWTALGLCGLAFGLTSPYIIWNLDGFVQDFGFQMRHVYQYGHGEDLGSGWIYHPTVTLRYGLGAMVLALTAGGVVVACLRRNRADWVLLGLFFAFYAVTGQGRTVFFRYALPLIPLCALFAGIAIDALRSLRIVPGQYRRTAGIALLALCLIEPLYASVRLNIMMGREDTRTQARTWMEANLPEGLLIANVGGVYGDVGLRNRYGVGWWLARYYQAFEVPEPDLVDYLTPFEADVPPVYLYAHYIGVSDLHALSRGQIETLDREDVAVVITHEHPLLYSDVDVAFMTELQRRADVWASFSPGDEEDLALAVFDQQDAFYYPMGRFGRLERGGPVIKIWHIRGRQGRSLEAAKTFKWLFRDMFFWMGNERLFAGDLQRAEVLYARTSRLDPAFADVHLFNAVTHIYRDDLLEAAEAIRLAVSLGSDIDLLEQAVFFGQVPNGGIYVRTGAACALAGYPQKAVDMYRQALALGIKTADVYNSLGVSYHAFGRYSEAVSAFEQALEIDPAFESARLNLDAVLSQKPAE